MGYYGLDWIAKAMILAAIYYLPTHVKRAEWLFIFCNVLTVTVAFMCAPIMWGAVVGDIVFAGMHFRNLRMVQKSAVVAKLTNVITNKGENHTITVR